MVIIRLRRVDKPTGLGVEMDVDDAVDGAIEH